jgi:hypothetical protein
LELNKYHENKDTMMLEKQFRNFYYELGKSKNEIDEAVSYVREIEEYFIASGKICETVTLSDLKKYISKLINEEKNNMERLQAIARYFELINRKDLYIYFTSILGGRSVLSSISNRLEKLVGKNIKKRVFEGVEAPPLGSPPEEFPWITQRLMKNLESEVSLEMCRQVLAGNHHRIPLENFLKHKEWYHDTGDIDEFLRKVHNEAIAELQRFMDENRIWYEQEITPQIIEYVRSNQEILSGVRKGNKIYFTKFPYSPQKWLDEKDPIMKKYYMCHCPLAREAILKGEPKISPEWCYCSAGYGKLKYDVIFEKETKAEVLENVFADNSRCRFAITIPEEKMKSKKE